MVDHVRDSWTYMMEGLAHRQHDHDHLLLKDPRQLGWSCRLAECRFFKHAAEFDGIAVLPCTA